MEYYSGSVYMYYTSAGPAQHRLVHRRGGRERKGKRDEGALEPERQAAGVASCDRHHQGSVLSNLGRQNDSLEAQRGHAFGRAVLGAAGLGLFVFLLVAEGFDLSSAGDGGHKDAAKVRLARKHGLDGVQRFMRLTDDTKDCSKTVFYEACIPALFGQGCTRFPVTGPCESEFCPRNCTGHGKCEEDTADAEASCACEAGFTGHFCATQLCPADCSGHGRCHALDGTCDCDEGFGGIDCAEVKCANNCTQPNGVCDTKTGICTCGTGYSGSDCR